MAAALTGHPLASALLVLLIPGLSLKRWLALGVFGLAAIGLGIVFALKLSLGPGFHSFVGLLSLRDTSSTVRGGVFISIGVVGAAFALFGLSRSLSNVRLRRRHWTLLDSLYVERILSGGPKVVVMGGGSGLPNLLRGLKHYTSNLTAIVTVADDGGSSGRLRSELGIMPPGDIRNCLVALADSEVVMQQLMDYRFSTNGQLDGHSFGNMLIAALAGIGGDFSKGVDRAGELLAIRGRVIPSTSTDIIIVGSTVSGQLLLGESRVGTATERLRSIALVPPDAPAHPDAAKAISEADLIILGPGSLFTSIVPNLLVRDIAAALASARGLKMYICNVAEEPGQTTGYSVPDHLNIIRHYAGDQSVDMIVANSNALPGRDSPSPSLIPSKAIWEDTAVRILADVIDEEIPTRHDPAKLAATVTSAYQKHRGSRRRLPLLRRNLQEPSQRE
ncbi:MAG: hypothetical protein BZY88_08375 [SAR202 cluster bacterium Io17-Chloro-G9]|nr:MAG: hypothetical protein BZY88_08375 [SAR202 cluster bacterium Io17-Chloro-G9]